MLHEQLQLISWKLTSISHAASVPEPPPSHKPKLISGVPLKGDEGLLEDYDASPSGHQHERHAFFSCEEPPPLPPPVRGFTPDPIKEAEAEAYLDELEEEPEEQEGEEVEMQCELQVIQVEAEAVDKDDEDCGSTGTGSAVAKGEGEAAPEESVTESQQSDGQRRSADKAFKANTANLWERQYKPSEVFGHANTASDTPFWSDLKSCHFGHMARIVETSFPFRLIMESLIFVNAALVGIEQEMLVRNLGAGLPQTFLYIDVFMASAFLVELFVRVSANGRAFYSWSNKDFYWNYFDSALVFCGAFEVLLKIMEARIFLDISTGRILRTMRLVRIVRVVRVLRIFKELRVMVLSILSSLKPLAFALALLSSLIYVVSVCFMHMVTEELVRFKVEDLMHTAEFIVLSDMYGTLGRTSYTLFLAISGGVSWGDVCAPLWKVSPLMGFSFMLYICFAVFCVLNIITGIFIEEANAKTWQDEEQMLIREMERRKRFIEEAQRFFTEADTDGTGQLTLQEFRACLENLRMQKLLENLGIDVVSCGIENVFQLFDFNSDGSIEVTEFNAGLQRLRGGARSIEIAAMRFDQQVMSSQVAKMFELMNNLAAEFRTRKPPEATSATPGEKPAGHEVSVKLSKKKSQGQH